MIESKQRRQFILHGK